MDLAYSDRTTSPNLGVPAFLALQFLCYQLHDFDFLATSNTTLPRGGRSSFYDTFNDSFPFVD